MTWVRLDDTFADDPVLDSAGPSAAWLHVAGLCYSNRNLTDGFIAADRVRRLTTSPDVEADAAQLVALGIWQLAAGGYRVVHHLDRQPTADQVQHERKLKTERQRRWRHSRDAARVDASTGGGGARVDASVDASRDASVDGAPSRPVPPRKRAGRAAASPPSDPPPAQLGRRPCADPNCERGWIGDDDDGRPRPCPNCRPNSAAIAARRTA